MNKVHRDATLKDYRPARFQTPSVDVLERLDCEPFYDELPLFVDEEFEDGEGGFNAAIDRLLDGLKKDKDRRINQKPAFRASAIFCTRACRASYRGWRE